MRICQGWMTCHLAHNILGRENDGERLHCSHAIQHTGNILCFTPCSRDMGAHEVCQEVKDECSGILGEQELEVQAD